MPSINIGVRRLYPSKGYWIGENDYDPSVAIRYSDYIKMDNELSKNAKRLFLYFSSNTIGKHYDPKFEQILKKTGLNTKTYSAAICELIKKGYVIKVSKDDYELVIPYEQNDEDEYEI